MRTTRPLSAKGLLARSMDELRRRSAIAWNLEAIKGPSGPRPLYDFCDEESVQDCIVMSDNRIGGSSKSSLDFVSPSSISSSLSVNNYAKGCPAGWTPENKAYPFPMDGLPPPSAFARFHGRISTSLPADRPNVHRSGFAAFRTPDQSASLFGNSVWDVDPYTYLALRVKSDGRAYFLNLQTEGIEPSDLHQHRLFARYPGQWETIMVNWNDFVRTNHGSVIEPQSEILRQKISTFGIGLTNRIEGPFELCIEKVWATNEIVDNAMIVTPKESQLRSRSGKKIYWRRDQLNLHMRQPSLSVEGPFMARVAKAFDWAIESSPRSHEKETVPSGDSQLSIRASEIIHSEEPQPWNSATVSQRSDAINVKEPRSGKSVVPSRKGEVHRSEESQSSWKAKANAARREAKKHQSNDSQGTKQRTETKSEDSGWDERGFGMGKHVRSRRRRMTTPLEEASREQTMQPAEKRHKSSNRDESMRSMTRQIRQKRMAVDLDDSQPQSSVAKPIRSSAPQLESSHGEGTVQEVETWRKNSSLDKMMQSGKIQGQRRGGEEMMQWAETLHQMTGSAKTPLNESTMLTGTQRGNSGEDKVAHSVQFKNQKLKHENTALKAELPRETMQSIEMPREETIPSAETQEPKILSRVIPREDVIQWAETSNEDSDQNKTTYSVKVQAHGHGREAMISTAETSQGNMAIISETLRQEIKLSTETHGENVMQSAEATLEKSKPLAGTQGDDSIQPAKTCQETIPSIETQGEQTVPSVKIPHEETVSPVETQREQATTPPPEIPRKEAAGPRQTPGKETIASAATQAPEIIRTAEMRCNEIMRLAEIQCRKIMQSAEGQCKGINRSAETRGEKMMRPIGEPCEEMQREETVQVTRVKERQLGDMQAREMLQSSDMSREEKQGKETQSEDSRRSDEAVQSGPQTQPASGGVQAAPSDEAQAGSDGGHGGHDEADRPGQGVLWNRKGMVVRW